MIFLEYELCKRRYDDAKQKVEDILLEQEWLFSKTQPQAIRYDRDKVITSGYPENQLENYVVEKERRKIESRLQEAKRIMDQRREYLKRCESDLRASKDIQDTVYAYRYIDRMSVYRICRKTGYSKSQMYRILDNIRDEICDICGGNE